MPGGIMLFVDLMNPVMAGVLSDSSIAVTPTMLEEGALKRAIPN